MSESHQFELNIAGTRMSIFTWRKNSDLAMEIRNGSSEYQAAATKTVLEEGDTSFPPARWGTLNTFFISFTYFRRLGATGELTVCLHSLSGLQEAGPEVTNSKYFSREQQSCDFEIGTGNSVLLAFFHYPIQFQTNSKVISIFQTHTIPSLMPRNWPDHTGPWTREASAELPLVRAE